MESFCFGEGVQAKSIVEKGYWDDLFPLEGGGRVHLQFQFALSEDDRSRIRLMRETALRRKHVEHQDRNHKSFGSNLASSFYLNPELSGQTLLFFFKRNQISPEPEYFMVKVM